MTIAQVTQISATSQESFDDAVANGIASVSSSCRKVLNSWVREKSIDDQEKTQRYRVQMVLTVLPNE